MLWQKRNLSKSSINNKLTQHSLQANHDMSPPTKSDTDSARVSSCICLTRPALLYGKGSLTVEAAFVVSLFFILVIILISFIDLVRVYAGITVSLNESAKKLVCMLTSARRRRNHRRLARWERGSASDMPRQGCPKRSGSAYPVPAPPIGMIW